VSTPNGTLTPEPALWDTLSPEERAILLLLADRDGPVGARVAMRVLDDDGLRISEASVSRVFVRLDAAGLTTAMGRKGRTLTAAGRALATRVRTSRRRNAGFSEALDIRSVEQLLDLLYARRGVEREAARAAARRGRPEEIEHLRGLLREQERLLAAGLDAHPGGMGFHVAVAAMAGGRLFPALAQVVLDESLEPLERVLEVITGGHGTLEDSAADHARIVEAIAARDGDAAEAAMAAHLSRLIGEVETFAGTGNDRLFERLLKLTR
jgi:GntR family transcriptional regulator, transcriptional repressor for pyruvate dehydrogenase complex